MARGQRAPTHSSPSAPTKERSSSHSTWLQVDESPVFHWDWARWFTANIHYYQNKRNSEVVTCLQSSSYNINQFTIKCSFHLPGTTHNYFSLLLNRKQMCYTGPFLSLKLNFNFTVSYKKQIRENRWRDGIFCFYAYHTAWRSLRDFFFFCYLEQHSKWKHMTTREIRWLQGKSLQVNVQAIK